MQKIPSYMAVALNRFQSLLPSLAKRQEGSTAVEYALMIGVLSGIMLASIRAVGNSSAGTFEQIAQSMEETREMAPQAAEIEAPTAVSIPAPRPAP